MLLVFGIWPQIAKGSQKTSFDSGDEEERINFVKKTSYLGHRDAKKILFLDEFSVKQFSVRRYWVWKPDGARWEENYTTPAVKHSLNQIIWGAMSFMGTAGLSF